MTICKWPNKPLSQVQVTVGETSMMATPERAYFNAAAVNEAVMAERERLAQKFMAQAKEAHDAGNYSKRDELSACAGWVLRA